MEKHVKNYIKHTMNSISMTLKKDYQLVYDRWLEEYEQAVLVPLDDYTFARFKRIVTELDAVPSEQGDPIKTELLLAYKDNFNYMLEDLIKIREIKILNTAFALKDIKFEEMTEAEVLFFKNLVAAIKGYEKVKSLTLMGADVKLSNRLGLKRPIEQDIERVKQDLEEKNLDMSQEVSEKTQDLREITEDLEQVSKEELELAALEADFEDDQEILDLFNEDLEDDAPKSEQLHSSQEVPALVLNDIISAEENDEIERDYQYTPLRFVKKSPAIVGVDLLTYGPFEKEDIASMPLKNAEILIREKYAEPLKL